MKNNYISLLLIILSILSVFFLKESYGQDAKQTMETIRKHAVSQTRLLDSVKFSFVTDIPGIGVDNVTYCLSGNKFYSELNVTRAETNIKPKISAYDGDKYQVLDRIEEERKVNTLLIRLRICYQQIQEPLILLFCRMHGFLKQGSPSNG
jgi:hypothetical protein